MKPAVRVENLSKLYHIGVLQKMRRRTLREAVMEAVTGPWRRLRQLGREPAADSAHGDAPAEDLLWALRDVSFEVQPGEVIGIIGRNGSGKSTLLKILSRIVEPTAGRAEVRGRLGSLLEVGTGFHPELTGRENTYLNGVLLGMSRTEIDRKFDEIVAFAEVEKFIDTPVKRYSSGMYVRLAFAVAAHLQPDILIVDEVLSVGDLPFQEKCLEVMERTSASGRTVLLVSHDTDRIRQMCGRVVYLKAGQVAGLGPAREVVHSYLSGAKAGSDQDQQPDLTPVSEWRDRQTNGDAHIVHLEITDAEGRLIQSLPIGSGIRFVLHVDFRQPVVDPCFGVVIHDEMGETILDLRSLHGGLRTGSVTGRVAVEVSVDRLGLYPGRYLLSPWVSDARVSLVLDWVILCRTLRVTPFPGPDGLLQIDPAAGKYWTPSEWRVV
jgi:lipopolysaccharide transport system ATP-binding protein